MEVKLGWWKDILMPKIVKVNSRSSGSNPYILSYGSETLLVNKYSDAENCQRQFKVIRGQFQNSEFNRLTYFVPSKGHRHILTVLYSSFFFFFQTLGLVLSNYMTYYNQLRAYLSFGAPLLRLSNAS